MNCDQNLSLGMGSFSFLNAYAYILVGFLAEQYNEIIRQLIFSTVGIERIQIKQRKVKERLKHSASGYLYRMNGSE